MTPEINYDSLLSDSAREIEFSGIRKFFDIAATMKNVISLSVGEPDFKTPWLIRKKAILALEKGRTRYTSNSGIEELRQAICVYMRETLGTEYKTDQILITVGGSEAIDVSLRALINPGDEVIVPEPSFVCYSPLVKLARGVPVPLVTREENNFKLMAADVEKAITEKTKAVILPFPNNPTGAVMRKSDYLEIAELLIKHNLIAISDEIYSELTYGDEKHFSISMLPGMAERTIVINGFSKAFAMTGWRLGWAAGPREILTQMLKIHQYGIMCSPTISQYAAITALSECRADVDYMVSEYDMRRKLCVKIFNDIGLPTATPEGAFYVFPSVRGTGLTSQEFCERLIREKQVAIVPGDAFGESGEGYVRVSYAYSLKHLSDAMKKVGEFLNELKSQ